MTIAKTTHDKVAEIIKNITAAGFTNANANQEPFDTQDIYSAKYYYGKNVILLRWYKGKLDIEVIENLSTNANEL